MTASRSRHLRLILGNLGCAAALGCADAAPVTEPEESSESRSALPALIVSNPAAPGPATLSTSRAALVDAVVYASLPPGSVTDGEVVRFMNIRTDAGATAAMVRGGLDPVPIRASAGDSLRIQVQRRGEVSERFFHAMVPPRRAPMVVRSDPAARRSDVPLNSRILVVFSEPLSDAAIGESAVQLTVAGARVPGVLSFADSAHVSLALMPDAPLAPGATYTVQISSALTDSDGDAIAEPQAFQFSTQSPGVVAPVGAIPACCTMDASFERTAPHTAGYRRSEFILRADGTFAMHYSDPSRQPSDLSYAGTYVRIDSTVALEFRANAGHPMGPWAAEATLSGDHLLVRFNPHASLADFEDGDYLRRPAGGGIPGDSAGRGRLSVELAISGVAVPLSVHGRLSGEAIRSLIDGTPASDHPTLPPGTGELSLAPGRYELSLQPPENCTASAPVEFIIAPGSTSRIALAVACSQWAWLSVAHEIESETSPTLTAIIYVCTGGRCVDYWPSSAPMWIPVAAGEHQVTFMGYPNCRARPAEGVSVTVSPGEVRSVTLSVWC